MHGLIKRYLALLPVLLLGQGVFSQTSGNSIPSLDELAGQWQDAASLQSLPALNSSQGSAQVAPNLLSVGNVSFPPITMWGRSGGLLIDDQSPALAQVRWYPYQVLRKGSAGDLGIETSVRMLYEQKGILFHVTLTNNADAPQKFVLRINLSAEISRHTNWGWTIPRDRDASRYTAVPADAGRSLMLKDSLGELAGCFSFADKPDELSAADDFGHAVWHLTLKPHSTRNLNYVLAVGENDDAVHALATGSAKHFDAAFAQVKADWSERFAAMFSFGSDYFSGHLPVLVTADEKLRRTYYMSAVSLLSVCRTCFPLAPRVYVSNTPEDNCIMMYFWDTREWATTLALLDPLMLKEYLRGWLAKGIYKGYAEEFLTGTLQGPWYSANDYSVFILLDSYLNVTGDRAFLSENIGGQTVLEHMDAIATNWKKLVRPGRTLADYGDARNLLECVPTYVNEVPSLNAANVWMMSRVAALDEVGGDTARAEALVADACRLLPAVLALYEPAQGVWDSLHRDGTRVPMRHVFDFATIGLTIKDDLTSGMRQQMTDFVARELLTDHWMRAQSLTDPAAATSDRPDHGPMGAFSAWPAETMAAFCEFGEYDLALDFLHRCSDTLSEGPFSQSRELMGRTADAPVRIASRGQQTYNASNGGAFAETIIREFFGYQPDLFGRQIIPDPRPRGFEGRLLNVQQGSRLYDITSTAQGLTISPAE